MKILVLAHKPPYPPVDGGTLATLNMCLGLAKAGNEVTVLTLSTPKHPGSMERIPREIHALINFEILHIRLSNNLLHYIFNLLFTRKPYNIQRYLSPIFKHIIRRTIQEKQFDIVQLEGLYLISYVKTISKDFKGPIVMRSHNVEHHIWESLAVECTSKLRAWYFGLLAKRIESIERRISHSVDALVAISNPDKDWFTQNNFNKPSITIPAGYFPSDKVYETEPNDSPAICYIGALDWLPNTEGLLWFIDWVWPRIQAEITNIEFHIAGRNAQESLADRLMAERDIVFHGQVANAAEFISKFPIMVVPLLSGSGIRVKIIEGMFLRKAIVATSMAAKGIDATHNEHILIADTPEAFASSVCSLIQSPQETIRIAENANTFASNNYDAINLAAKLTTFYQGLL
ncbi:MAG: glycosyltransferase [Bacteroidales bacterium]|nr:glycosyltransferase [Bacteroidales bacterium]